MVTIIFFTMKLALFVLFTTYLFEAVSCSVSVLTYAELTCIGTVSPLPNVVYAKVDPKTRTRDQTCSNVIVGGFNETYTFYYYDLPYVNGTDCSLIKSVTGTAYFREIVSLRELGTTINIDLLGTFLDGPYINKVVTTAVIYPTTNVNQCNTAIGLELLTANMVVSVVGGPTCNGIAVKKFCPGIHYPETQDITITIPLIPALPPIKIPGLPGGK